MYTYFRLAQHRASAELREGVPGQGRELAYTRSPLEDSRLFAPSPWKILATTYDKNDF